jgi:putative ABC transport system permease protein
MIFFRTLKVNFRQLFSQKLNSTVHIAGLSLGMSVCLLIGLFIRFELSFDNYHPNADRIYRINQVWTNNGTQFPNHSTGFPLANELRHTTTGLEHIVFAQQMRSAIIDVSNGKRFQENRIMITDPAFLDVFKVELIDGKGHETLRTPYQALLTESIAKKFFGTENAIGKTFRYKSKFDITVGGVIKDLPANTHLPATIILSYVANNDYIDGDPNAWQFISGTATYVVIPKGYDLSRLEAQLKRIADEYCNSDPDIPKFIRTDFALMPLSEIHFDLSTGGSHWVPAVHTTWIWFFGTIGFAVLTLACINFVNLSTAQSLTRAKEVGVRKTIGAGRINLVFQFLGESWLLAAISGIIAIGIAQVCLPYMNVLLEKNIPFELFNSPALLMAIFFCVAIVGLFAGLYPAWIVTKFNPATSLRSTFNRQGERGSSWLRRSLVVVQFVISAGLLISLLVISDQVNYMRSKDLGFNKNNVIITSLGSNGESAVYNAELEKIPQVESWSYATTPPSSKSNFGTSISTTDANNPEQHAVNVFFGDDKFCSLYGLKLLAGRFPIASDTNLVSMTIPQSEWVMKGVVNEKLLDVLNLGTAEEAVGKHFWFGITGNMEIVGVVADFNTTSLHQAIAPVVIGQFNQTYSMTGIRIHPGSNIPETIAAIEKAWKVSYPNGVFNYKFLDEQIDAYYKSEERVFQLFRVFSGIAMFISCLGLWGLITFSAQRRMKEIGIRKVLGATASSIVRLLSLDFVYTVVVALAIAGPLSYYGISKWLDAFAYKVPIGWQAFAIAGGISLMLALVTVGIQSLRATFTNPASVLKSE